MPPSPPRARTEIHSQPSSAAYNGLPSVYSCPSSWSQQPGGQYQRAKRLSMEAHRTFQDKTGDEESRGQAPTTPGWLAKPAQYLSLTRLPADPRGTPSTVSAAVLNSRPSRLNPRPLTSHPSPLVLLPGWASNTELLRLNSSPVPSVSLRSHPGHSVLDR